MPDELSIVTFPVERVVPATFTFVGDIQPIPVDDLDDTDSEGV